MRDNIRTITTYGIYTSIFLLMALVPFIGYITFGPLKATLMAIPVLIVAIHKKIIGAIYGTLMFGLTSLLSALIQGSNIVANYGWLHAIVILFIGRQLILIPLIPMILLLEKFFNDENVKNIIFKGFIYALIISISNTLIVIGLIVAFSNDKRYWVFITSIAINLSIEWTVPPLMAIFTASLIKHLIKTDKDSINNKW